MACPVLQTRQAELPLSLPHDCGIIPSPHLVRPLAPLCLKQVPLRLACHHGRHSRLSRFHESGNRSYPTDEGQILAGLGKDVLSQHEYDLKVKAAYEVWQRKPHGCAHQVEQLLSLRRKSWELPQIESEKGKRVLSQKRHDPRMKTACLVLQTRQVEPSLSLPHGCG